MKLCRAAEAKLCLQEVGGEPLPPATNKEPLLCLSLLVLLVTFLRLMLPLFLCIQIGLELCARLSVFPDKELASIEAKDIKKDKGY